MARVWQFVWPALASIAIVCAGGIALLLYLFWPKCDRGEKVLARDTQGRSVVSVFEACTGLGTTMEESIELRSASGDRTAIFNYAPNGGIAGCKGKAFPPTAGPTVDWSNPNVIHISLGVVDSIFQKLDVVDHIRITYEIGTVVSEVCRSDDK